MNINKLPYHKWHKFCEGDCLDICLSEDGVLEFTVNGESQGIEAGNTVYAFVDHCWSDDAATVITKACGMILKHLHTLIMSCDSMG